MYTLTLYKQNQPLPSLLTQLPFLFIRCASHLKHHKQNAIKTNNTVEQEKTLGRGSVIYPN